MKLFDSCRHNYTFKAFRVNRFEEFSFVLSVSLVFSISSSFDAHVLANMKSRQPASKAGNIFDSIWTSKSCCAHFQLFKFHFHFHFIIYIFCGLAAMAVYLFIRIHVAPSDWNYFNALNLCTMNTISFIFFLSDRPMNVQWIFWFDKIITHSGGHDFDCCEHRLQHSNHKLLIFDWIWSTRTRCVRVFGLLCVAVAMTIT